MPGWPPTPGYACTSLWRKLLKRRHKEQGCLWVPCSFPTTKDALRALEARGSIRIVRMGDRDATIEFKEE